MRLIILIRNIKNNFMGTLYKNKINSRNIIDYIIINCLCKIKNKY